MRSDTQESNNLEWRDERNWHVRHLIYFAPRDTRVVVPKWNQPSPNGTLNFGRPVSILALVLVFIPPLFILAALPKLR